MNVAVCPLAQSFVKNRDRRTWIGYDPAAPGKSRPVPVCLGTRVWTYLSSFPAQL